MFWLLYLKLLIQRDLVTSKKDKPKFGYNKYGCGRIKIKKSFIQLKI